MTKASLDLESTTKFLHVCRSHNFASSQGQCVKAVGPNPRLQNWGQLLLWIIKLTCELAQVTSSKCTRGDRALDTWHAWTQLSFSSAQVVQVLPLKLNCCTMQKRSLEGQQKITLVSLITWFLYLNRKSLLAFSKRLSTFWIKAGSKYSSGPPSCKCHTIVWIPMVTLQMNIVMNQTLL